MCTWSSRHAVVDPTRLPELHVDQLAVSPGAGDMIAAGALARLLKWPLFP